ncbi:hypothetical protein FHX08_000243 [Rhizobium sp. BK529]|uniref:hypothetical protein n=1 Tax=unclassified Rhizobium TaxID=2613769 RepID=UPI00104DD655|nr:MULTISPECIES: hypothetical protein [unclassified Rhizobium]MBB3589899.1 hypothetical protein [Rhizobium sp. BK529]TCS04566.1 hypothetical protein EV281_103240 [Rhizobium sp. BK418]
MRQKALQSPAAPQGNPITDRLVLASRYQECLRRLSRAADRLHHADLGEKLMEIARCMERMSDEIAINEAGVEVLRRAARLIGIVEALVDRKAKASILH